MSMEPRKYANFEISIILLIKATKDRGPLCGKFMQSHKSRGGSQILNLIESLINLYSAPTLLLYLLRTENTIIKYGLQVQTTDYRFIISIIDLLISNDFRSNK